MGFCTVHPSRFWGFFMRKENKYINWGTRVTQSYYKVHSCNHNTILQDYIIKCYTIYITLASLFPSLFTNRKSKHQPPVFHHTNMLKVSWFKLSNRCHTSPISLILQTNMFLHHMVLKYALFQYNTSQHMVSVSAFGSSL